jgi:hypothetical protein
MTAPESSSRKVPYDLRPRKQVERRMMAHVFQLLSEAGFHISTYTYAGFGAFFFVDFILFRRLLGITDMISIEHDLNSEKRVLFNRPFKDIEVQFLSSTDYLSAMNRDKPHILWLDYDGPIVHDCLVDIEIAASRLSTGSVLMATLDVDFDKVDDINIKESLPNQRAHAWFNRFQEECGELFDPAWKNSNFNAASIPKRTIEVVKNAILSGLNMRDGITFEPLFNFLYADGHEMLTIGGVICSKQEKRKLRLIEWEELPFVRRKLSTGPFRIKVPVLTRKERLYIDSYMPSDPDWVPDEFEIEPEAIQDYREVYRYCPLYAELLL